MDNIHAKDNHLQSERPTVAAARGLVPSSSSECCDTRPRGRDLEEQNSLRGPFGRRESRIYPRVWSSCRNQCGPPGRERVVILIPGKKEYRLFVGNKVNAVMCQCAAPNGPDHRARFTPVPTSYTHDWLNLSSRLDFGTLLDFLSDCQRCLLRSSSFLVSDISIITKAPAAQIPSSSNRRGVVRNTVLKNGV